MSLVVILLVVAILLWFYKLLMPSPRLWKYGNKIPGPKPLPIIGNALIFIQSKTVLGASQDVCNKYGSCVRIWLGKQLFLILADPADVEFFLSSTKYLDKSNSYRLIDAWLGTKGLLTSDADVWRLHRKLLTPSFHFKILETSIEMMRRHSKILCEQLECMVNQSEFDIFQFTEKCSLDIICEGVLGTNMDSQKSNDSGYLKSIKELSTCLVLRIFQPWLHHDLTFRFSKIGRRFYSALAIVKSTVAQVVAERRKALMKQYSETNDTMEQTGRKQVKPFLDFMLVESNFTDEEIENEVQTFMFAGHDTTTTTIAFCLYELSKHPDVQDKVLQEVRSVLLNRDTKPLYSDYHNMRYLDHVIKETLRKYTTVPFISRKVPEDIKLPSGHLLPAGSLVNLFLYYMHNDEKYFPNPGQFIPERFETMDNNKHPYMYVPFSAGPRNCIGQKFAMLEMKIVLSTLLLEYEFLPSERVTSLTIESYIVLRSLENTPVRITHRNKIHE